MLFRGVCVVIHESLRVTICRSFGSDRVLIFTDPFAARSSKLIHGIEFSEKLRLVYIIFQ